MLVACHNCSDATYTVCQQFQERFPSFKLLPLVVNDPRVNNVGAIRRILMHLAAKRLNDPQGFVAMTDADTLVHPHWVASLIRPFARWVRFDLR